MTDATDGEVKTTSEDDGFITVSYRNRQKKTPYRRKRGGRRTKDDYTDSSGSDGKRAGLPRQQIEEDTTNAKYDQPDPVSSRDPTAVR